MSSRMELPLPPQTPSPISDEGSGASQVDTAATDFSDAAYPYDANSLAPLPQGARIGFYNNASSFIPMADSPSNTPPAADIPNPFGFNPQTYSTEKAPPVYSLVGQRRGHKYKHSSVSHQIFQEPTRRAPLRLPASLPIPTREEGWKSMSSEQTARVAWCFCHLFIAAYVQWTAQGSLALTALSHLIFYDAIGALFCGGVEVLSNFEVWKRSSIRHPFGLERSEVLIGFGMSILLLFMGFDLLSHNAGDLLSHAGEHTPHRAHNHHDLSTGSMEIACLCAIAATLISAVMLKNHARIAKSMRFSYLSLLPLPSALNNPSYLLTLSCSAIILVIPLFSIDLAGWVDHAISSTMAVLMCILGFQLVKTLGAMLLMSYQAPLLSGSRWTTSGKGPDTGPTAVSSVLRDIEADPSVKEVEEAKFWQVHYNLCMANLKLRVTGSEQVASKLRERIQNLVRTRLGGEYGATSGGLMWEVSTQLTLDSD